jgi:ribosomal protein L11 methyltransferase
VPDDSEAPAAVDATERALWHLQAFGLRPVSKLKVIAVDDADWAEAWKAGYAPQRIGKIVIVPSWLDEPVSADDIEIRLDPGMAFGTGLHPTTRGCLLLLQGVSPTPATVLDLGSGSGILGIAALRLGAQRVVALDTDALAVEATGRNADENGVGDRLTARRGTLGDGDQAGPPFPLILANLVAAILIDFAPAIAANLEASGTLIASGIIAERAAEVLAAFDAAKLDLVDRLDDGEWVSLRLARRA